MPQPANAANTAYIAGTVWCSRTARFIYQTAQQAAGVAAYHASRTNRAVAPRSAGAAARTTAT